MSRPGTPLPASSAPYLSGPQLPPPEEVVRQPRGRLRRSLTSSSAEGMVAEVVSACAGGAVLTGWALYLGCNPFWIAMLGALPFFAQLAQLPAAWFTAFAGQRRVAIAAVCASRQALRIREPRAGSVDELLRLTLDGAARLRLQVARLSFQLVRARR